MKLAGAPDPRQQQRRADGQQGHLVLGLRLERGDFCARFSSASVLSALLSWLRRNRRDFGRRRREGDLAVMGHGRATDHVVFHVVIDLPSFSGVRSVIMWRMLVA